MEEQIIKLMKALDISREEAIKVIEDDKKVDKMTSLKEINSDLTEEQKKVWKKARQVAKAVSTTPVAREKKVNAPKRELMTVLTNAINAVADNSVNVLNEEREFEFIYGGSKYKIVLSAPRK